MTKNLINLGSLRLKILSFLFLIFLFLAANLSAQENNNANNDKDDLADIWNSTNDRDERKDVFDEFTKKPTAIIPKNPMVTLRFLDKTVARFFDKEIPLNKRLNFGSISVIPRNCYKRPEEEFPETAAELLVLKHSKMKNNFNFIPSNSNIDDDNSEENFEINEQESIAKNVEDTGEIDNVEDTGEIDTGEIDKSEKIDDTSNTDKTDPYKAEIVDFAESKIAKSDILLWGWLFKSNPAINSLEHPIYDVWVIDCNIILPSN